MLTIQHAMARFALCSALSFVWFSSFCLARETCPEGERAEACGVA
jgi:hypothetical protein